MKTFYLKMNLEQFKSLLKTNSLKDVEFKDDKFYKKEDSKVLITFYFKDRTVEEKTSLEDANKFILKIEPCEKVTTIPAEIQKLLLPYLRENPFIKCSLFKDLKDKSNLEKEIAGIYKDGRLIKNFNKKTYSKTVLEFFKNLEFDEATKEEFLKQYNPSWDLNSSELNGYDLVFLDKKGNVCIRCQKAFRYTWIENLGLKILFYPYKSKLEK